VKAGAGASAGPCGGSSGGGGGDGDDSPIQALPSFSQLDPSVMDALPLALRRELEVAYGEPAWGRAAFLALTGCASGGPPAFCGCDCFGSSTSVQWALVGQHYPPPCSCAGIGRPARSPPGQRPKRGRPPHAAGHPRPASKRQRLDAFLSHSGPPAAQMRQQQAHHQEGQQQEEGQQEGQRAEAAHGDAPGPLAAPAQRGGAGAGAPPAVRLGTAPTSLSQVDPEVLEELPPGLRSEILAQLTPGGAARWRTRQRAGGAGARPGSGQGPGPSRLGLSSAAIAAAEQPGGGGGHSSSSGDSMLPRESPGERVADGWQQARGEEAELAQGEGPSSQPQQLALALPAALREWLDQAAGREASRPGAGPQLGPALELCLEEWEERWGAEQSDSRESQGGLGVPHKGGSMASRGASQEPLPSGGAAAAAGGREGAAAGAGGSGHLAALDALCEGLVAGCSALVAERLDELKAALQALQRLGRQRPWFAAPAARVVRSVQGMVRREHGWELRLSSWLEEG
jgi:hypothetical protein